MSLRQTQLMMGMPITVEIADTRASDSALQKVFDYFQYVDNTFSTYKDTSEVTAINKGLIPKNAYSKDMKTVFALSEETKKITHGYFDIARADGTYDPSGLVKGWAICNAANLLADDGYQNFYIDAGGDIEARGYNSSGNPWRVGIRNPFNQEQIVKTLHITNTGVATSGTYIRGQHIYNPKERNLPIEDILSLTVIGPNVYEADRFATAAFAMGKEGISFIETGLDGFEGYMIKADGIATMTSGFEKYTKAQHA